MTSRRLFFSAMKEDLRHKIWMIALFGLISFLALPMPWLVMSSSLQENAAALHYYNETELYTELNAVFDFFVEYLAAMGGFIAITAGLIIGLFNFRYIFHKNKVDVYHSLPIKRSMLYGVCYADGILIWCVPFLVCIVLMLILAGGYAGRIGGMGAAAKMWGAAGQNFLLLLTVFLMVYHLVLIAVMMSGNMLNALVNLLLIGFGASGVYGMWIIFMQYYMRTFLYKAFSDEVLIYASPFLSACCLLIEGSALTGTGEFWELLLWYVPAVLLMGLCGWALYRRRASELAEQGVRNKAVTAILRVTAGTAAGMGGWMLFVMLTDNLQGFEGLLWKSFGAVLTSGLVFGVLNVIFHMEFGAFFSHKIQMAGTILLTLFCCAAFSWDWFGYDAYLPPKEEIAQIAVYDRQFSNRNASYRDVSEYVLEHMQYQNTDVIYSYLECAANLEKWMAENRNDSEKIAYESLNTKITLKNGRSYYRRYSVPADKELLWPLLASQEYLTYNYLFSDEEIAGLRQISLYREGEQHSAESAETAAAIARAYNQDVSEHAQEILAGEGKLLAEVRLRETPQKNRQENSYFVMIYSFMEHTMEALTQAGYEEWVREWEASEISIVRLGLYAHLDGTETEEDIISKVMGVYGISESGLENRRKEGGESAEQSSGISASELPASETLALETSHQTDYGIVWDMESGDAPMLEIVNPAEIEELLPYIGYTRDAAVSPLRRQYVKAEVIDSQGETRECYFPKGCLPMKYIYRFVDVVNGRKNGDF